MSRWETPVLPFLKVVSRDNISCVAERYLISFAQRQAEKQAARDADARALAEGRKSVAQLGADNASFAFGRDRATHVLTDAQPRFDEYQLEF